MNVLVALALSLPSSAAEPAYLRYPDLSSDSLVFAAEGDLFVAPIAGGRARRLTSGPGEEKFPHYSPDGSMVAFSAVYEGNEDVFVVPADGGEPKRLTWHPGPDEVVGWAPDGKSVIFRSIRTDPNSVWRLYQVPATGGDTTELPLGWAGRVDIDPKTGMWAITRLGRDTATWKRYRGGWAEDIWVGDPKKADFHQVTTFPGADAFPMWHDGRIFFLCDQGGTANLWSMNADGSDRQQLTTSADWDVRWPSMGPDGRIAYTLGGDVHVYDPAKKAESAVAIDLPGERLLARVRYPDVTPYITTLDVAPDGDRVAMVARGEVFSVPVKPGVVLPVTRSAAREKFASYSPDGTRIAYVTDAPGEEQIVTADAWGRGDVKVIQAPGTHGWFFPPAWSSDGKFIAYSDETQTLWVAPADGSSAPRNVDKSDQAEIREYTWSPDGRWLAYTKLDRRDMSGVWVWDVVTGEKHRVGGAYTSDYSPAWDPEGRYLYLVSNRAVDPFLGDRDFSDVLLMSGKIYAVMLRPDVPNPVAANEGLPPPPGAPPVAQEEKKKREKERKKKRGETEELPDKPKPVVITWDGIENRVVELPISAGNYGGLAATSDKLFFGSYAIHGMADEDDGGGPDTDLMAYDLEAKKADVFLGGISGYGLALRGAKLLIERAGAWDVYVVPTTGAPGDLTDAHVDLSGAVVEVDPRAEWKQIFDEAWRNERDFFWDSGMGGIDWKAVHDQYASLLPRLATREDLRDLIGEMIGELGTSHTYVGGGDIGDLWVGGPSVGELGADLVREGKAFKITRIYHGDPADREPSPLMEPGVVVKEGQYVTAVNRQPVRSDVPFEAMLADLAGKRVILTIADDASGKNAHDVAVTPLGSEAGVRYADWVRRNREYVSQKTGGKIGYVHIPDMGGHGLTEFERWWFPQLDKEGWVIDVRWNRGGFVSPLILERLRRQTIAFDRARGGGVDTYPEFSRNGPFVVLTNEFAGSDGDIFPTAVQAEGLAPVIGARSWGGVIGIRGDKPMVDNGFLSQPEFAFWFKNRGWGVENNGVVPDVPVQNAPQDVASGKDPQLDKAIEEVMKLHDSKPPIPMQFPPPPDKSKKAFQEKEK